MLLSARGGLQWQHEEAHVNSTWQRYLDMASGLTQVTQRKAESVVKTLVRQGEVAADRAERVVDELLTRSDANRKAIASLVKTETQRAVERLNLARQRDVERLETKVTKLASQPKPSAASSPGPKKSTPEKSAKASPTKAAKAAKAAKTAKTTKTPAAKGSPAKSSPAKSSPAKASAAKSSPAKAAKASAAASKRTSPATASAAPAAAKTSKGSAPAKGAGAKAAQAKQVTVAKKTSSTAKSTTGKSASPTSRPAKKTTPPAMPQASR